MTFLNPLVLLGLAAAAIPILIHLFNFRRPRRVDFSSLRFLRELESKAMRRVRIRQWLLLALRTLAIACLVVAFARPALQSAWAGVFGERPAASVALVLDNSLSTTLRDAEGAFFAQAQALATRLVETGGPGDEFFLVPMADTTDGAAGALVGADAALDALAGLRPAPGAETATAALARAASRLEEAQNLRREIVLFSDLQAATLGDSARAPVPEGIELTLLPVGAARRQNTAVTGVRVESRIVEAGQPVQISATLVRYGDAADDVVARLLLDGQPVAQTAADLAPNVPTTVRFTVTPRTRGWLAGEVRIEDDEANWDNARPFALEVPGARRVLLVRGAGQRADFVALALSLGAERGTLVLNDVDESALARADLATTDAVVLVGPRTVSAGAAQALARYVEGGGGVLLFPGDGAEAGANAVLAALGGGRLNGVVGTAGGESLGGFTGADLDHPLFGGLFDDVPGPRTLESPEVSLAARYVPGGGDESSLVRLEAGPPFLHEVRRGRGALLLFAVAPDPRWSDFPLRGLFVPLLYRAVSYLAAESTPSEAALVVGQPGAFRVAGVEGAEPLRLVGPDGEGFAVEGRAVPGGLLVEAGAEVRRPGVYEVRQDARLLRRVAFALDPRESDLRALGAAEARGRLEAATGRPVRVLDAAEGAGLEAAEANGRSGFPLWTILLAVAALALVAETLVATRWRETKG